MMTTWKALEVGLIAVVAASCSEARAPSLARRSTPLVWGGQQELVASDAAELDEFGRAVALTTDRALVGAYGESNARGAAYVFVRNGNGWTEEQKLVASDGVELDKLGYAIAIAGDRALVGAYGASANRGAAYVFVRSGASWSEEQKLVANDGVAGDNFGWSVALTADRALIGATGRDAARGAAYVFVRSGNSWTEEQTLDEPDAAESDNFGYSVALSADPAGDRALVGAPGRDNFRGAAHVFVRIGGAWAEEQKLVTKDGTDFDQLGNSVSLAGNRALVGAYWKSDLAGAAYVFVRGGVAQDPPWTEEQVLVASDGADGDRFAGAISLAADRALIGALGPGAAYVFARTGSSWSQEQRLVPSGVPSFDLFGWSVALTEDRALVGASYTDQLRGAAYVYSLGVADGDAGAVDAGAVEAGDAPDGEDAGSIDAGTPGSCTRGDDCASGHCEDGICCDRTCAASERCRAELKVSGEDGVCGPAKAAAPGAPCAFDVQCTSGHCSGADGVCGDTDRAPDATGTGGTTMTVPVPTDAGGCACAAATSPLSGPSAWLGIAFALLFLRRTRLGESSLGNQAVAKLGRVTMRRHLALALIFAVAGFGGCGGRPVANGRDGGGGTGAGGETGDGDGGATGAAGTTGVAGTTGRASTAGTTGAAGTTGGAGAAGTTGVAGTTGAAGAAGTAGGGSARTMGVMGCYLAVNVMRGYQSVGGMRMWPPDSAPYGGQVVQSWTPASGGVWSAFDDSVRTYGTPTDVWIMLCVARALGATTAEVRQIVENARAHAPGANIHITGEPLYQPGWTCQFAGSDGPELTDRLAQAAANPADNVFYAGTFFLDGSASPSEVSLDTCDASSVGELSLGNQAVAKWGK